MIDLQQCPCAGKNLDKLLQPMILVLLDRERLHGYALVQRLAESPMVGTRKPDPTGVYRMLKTMEEREIVSAVWDDSLKRLPRKIYTITPLGRECLASWIRTLRDYRDSIEAFLSLAGNDRRDPCDRKDGMAHEA
ncbi:MAG: PadR family transcriptional regulator [Syntrophobacteraceae bacterium]|nr:PadR family transcriptional regulator [Desulfobacteraceae bacterium]